jgi:signal transduction histidine kinase
MGGKMSVQIPVSGQAEEPRIAAEQSRQAMARLMAVAGHDLKQPIQVATLSIALAIGESVPARVAKRLRIALDAMRRLNSELDDIARLSQQHIAALPRPRSVDLDEILAEVERDWRAYAGASGTALEIGLSGVRIETDPAMLRTILRNLVGNAIRHAGPRGRVSISCRRRGDRLRISVQDDGDGIPVAHLSRIFDAFERCGAPGHDDGLGLGLTIVRQTAELLHHPLSVRSVENEGSTFSIELPLLGPRLAQTIDADFARPGSN